MEAGTSTAARARSLAGWLRGRGEELPPGRVVALSVHLDDAIFSIGAALARAARRGADVTVLTVLGNDPASDGPAGEWDARAGFRTAAEAAAARRAEDRRACALVGARPVWLPFGDMTYEHSGEEASIAASVLAHTDAADTVLLPGFPLHHDDHRRLAAILADRLDPARTRRFVEQPYAALWTAGPADPAEWQPLAAAPRDRLAKLRACRAYRSQLPLLGSRPVYATARYEALRGGEWIRREPG